MFLKRATPQNIVIGGLAGAAPPLLGWTAVTGEIHGHALLLVLIIFAWTPPHFWALAVKYRDDYSAANVPMLPSVTSLESTARQIVIYSVAVWALGVAFAPIADMGWIYLAVSIISGGMFTLYAVQLLRDPTSERAMKVFTFSLTYLTALFIAMAVDQLVLA